MLRATNTWDFPTYAAIVVLRPGAGRPARACCGWIAARSRRWSSARIVFGVAFQFSFAPYLQRYQLFYNGVDPVKAQDRAEPVPDHPRAVPVPRRLAVRLVRRAGAPPRRGGPPPDRRWCPSPGYYGMILPLAGLNGYASPAGWAAGVGRRCSALALVAGGLRHARLPRLRASASPSAACIAHWRRSNRALQAALFGGRAVRHADPRVRRRCRATSAA